MFSYFSFYIGIIILLISLIIMKKSSHNPRKSIFFLTIGIFFSTFFFVFPTFNLNTQSGESFIQVLHNIVASLLYSFDTLGGGQNIQQIDSFEINSSLKNIYLILNYISFILAPILASSLVISFFGDFNNRFRYLFNFSKICYCFSDLTESTLIQAQTINRRKKRIIVFFNCKEASDSLKERATKSGFILFNKKCSAFTISKKHKNYEFYLANPDEYESIKLLEQIIIKNSNIKNIKITLNTFVKNETNIAITESLIKQKNNDNIAAHFINETSVLCNHLLYSNPLYAYPSAENNKLISVLLIGCGSFGMQMLKIIMWYTQIIGFSAEINVFDKNAKAIKNKLYMNCPELTERNYNIRFTEADVEEKVFFDELKNISFPGYVIIATDNDELNFNTAIQLQAELKRTNYNYEIPPVFVRLRTQLYENSFFNKNDFLKNRNIHPFGSIEEIYSTNTLFNTYLEKLALAVHLCYAKCLDKSTDKTKYKNALAAFKNNEYSRRSSIAAALHIFPKLYSCGIINKTQNCISDEDADRFEKLISSDKAIVEKLAANEHSRWMAFMRSEGYRYVAPESFRQHIFNTQKDRNDITKQHICIADWEKLDGISEEFNTIIGIRNKKNFKKNDIDIIMEIPQIIKKANELMKEE